MHLSKNEETTSFLREANRILAESERRKEALPPDKYSCWQPGQAFMLAERRRVAIDTLRKSGVRLTPQSRCLEVGCGYQGWLTDLLHWGVNESNLSGIDLDSERVNRAVELLPSADLRQGDATDLPWEDGEFELVVVSLVFTSILDRSVRKRIADEITRVLKPGGVLLWYDFRVNNPFNPNVLKVSSAELKRLFPRLRGRIRSLTPLPPLCNILAQWGWFLPALLGLLPVLRTHLLGVFTKQTTD
jgi:SAM-dependent methyltransferase